MFSLGLGKQNNTSKKATQNNNKYKSSKKFWNQRVWFDYKNRLYLF